MSSDDMGLPGKRRTWLWVCGVGLAAVLVLVAAGLVIGPRLKSPAQAAADAAPPPASRVTAVAERRVLSETMLFRGAVEAGPSIKILSPVTGAGAVVTAVPLAKGATVAEGTVLAEVAGNPVYALVLDFPLYRDLTDGLQGPDVAQVQRALRRLGYGSPTTRVFDAGTQDALRRFYKAHGYEVPTQAASPSQPPTQADQTKKGDAGPPAEAKPMLPKTHVVRLDQADRKVSAVPITVGAVLDPAKATTQNPQNGQTDSNGQKSQTGQPGQTGQAQQNASAPDPTLLVELDAGPPTIVATVPTDQAALVKAGMTADIQDEVHNLTTQAVVQTVGTEPKQSPNGGTGLEIRLTFSATALDPTPNHTVRVTVGATNNTEKVLAVPLTAVYSHADGSTFVTVEQGGALTDITVRTGKIAGGWVQVSPAQDGVTEGSRVVVGSQSPPGGTPTGSGGHG